MSDDEPRKINPATEQLIRDLARDEMDRKDKGMPVKKVYDSSGDERDDQC